MFQFFAHILCYDLWFYIIHILLHKKLYFVHIYHHYNWKPTFLDFYTSHWLETYSQYIGIMLPLLYYKYLYTQFLYAMIFVNVRGIMKHDERTNFIFGNHHMLHHKYPKYNFGEYWIDYLGGTLYPNEEEYIYGLIKM